MSEATVDRTLVVACDEWGCEVAMQLEGLLQARHEGIPCVGAVRLGGGVETMRSLDGVPLTPAQALRALSRAEAAAELAARGLRPGAPGEIAVWLVGGATGSGEGVLQRPAGVTRVLAAVAESAREAGAALGALVSTGGLWRVESDPLPPLERGWLLVGALREDGLLLDERAVTAAAAEILYQMIVTPVGAALVRELDRWVPDGGAGQAAVVGLARAEPPGPALAAAAGVVWSEAALAWLTAPVPPPAVELPALTLPAAPPVAPGRWAARVAGDLGALPARLRQWQDGRMRTVAVWEARPLSLAPAAGEALAESARSALLQALDDRQPGSLCRAAAMSDGLATVLSEAQMETAADEAASAAALDEAVAGWEVSLAALERAAAPLPEPEAWWEWASLLLRPWHWRAALRALSETRALASQAEAAADRLVEARLGLVQAGARRTALAGAAAVLAPPRQAVARLVEAVTPPGDGGPAASDENADPLATSEAIADRGGEAEHSRTGVPAVGWPAWLGPVPEPALAGPAWLDHHGPLSRWLARPEALPGALAAAGLATVAPLVPRDAEQFLARSGTGLDALVREAQPLGRLLAWQSNGHERRVLLIGSTLGPAGPLAWEGATWLATEADDLVVMTALVGVRWAALAGAAPADECRVIIGECQSEVEHEQPLLSVHDDVRARLDPEPGQRGLVAPIVAGSPRAHLGGPPSVAGSRLGGDSGGRAAREPGAGGADRPAGSGQAADTGAASRLDGDPLGGGDITGGRGPGVLDGDRPPRERRAGLDRAGRGCLGAGAGRRPGDVGHRRRRAGGRAAALGRAGARDRAPAGGSADGDVGE